MASAPAGIAGTTNEEQADDENRDLPRRWQNARTHPSYAPVTGKYHHIGNDALLPNHGQI